MGILERMRSGSDSTFMQVVLAVIIVAFIGLNGRMFGDRSAVVATVNGHKILETDFQRSYRMRLNSAERDANRMLSDAEQKEIAEQVRQGMIEREVILQEAHRLGLEVSDSEITRELLAIPSLRGPDGKFSKEKYQDFLKRQQVTRDDFEARQRDDLLYLKLRTLMVSAASMSDPAVVEMFVDQNTKVDLNLVRVRPGAFENQVTVTDEERTTWLAANEAQVKETYDRDFDRLYNKPAQVQLRMIRIAVEDGGPNKADLLPYMNKLRDRISAGEDMAELAKRWSEDPTAIDGGDLGLRPVAQLASEITHGIEGVEVGGLSSVITTDKEVMLLRVEQKTEPKVEALDAVKNTIADRLIKAEKVPALAADFAENQLLPAWTAAGAPPMDLLEGKGITPRQTGPIPTFSDSPVGPPADLLEAARKAPVGSVLPEVYESGGMYFVAQLTDRIEPDLAVYEANKDRFREQALAARRMGFYSAWIADLKSQAKIQ